MKDIYSRNFDTFEYFPLRGASSGVCIKMEQNVYLNAIATTTMLRRCREDVFKSKVRGGFRFVRNDFLCGCIVVVVVRKMLMNTLIKVFPILDARFVAAYENCADPPS